MSDEVWNLPGAQMSPRVINGVIKWYEGDTFTLTVEFELVDQDDEAVEIKTEDVVEFVFRDRRKRTVKTFAFENVENNTVTLVFDDAVTALFPAGEYTYDVYYNGTIRRTLSNDSCVIVE